MLLIYVQRIHTFPSIHLFPIEQKGSKKNNDVVEAACTIAAVLAYLFLHMSKNIQISYQNT